MDDDISYPRNTIWKFPIDLTDGPYITISDVPIGAEILDVQSQRGFGCIWMKVNTSSPKEARGFIVVGTNHDIPPYAGKYIGTWQEMNDTFVWHLFEDVR